MDATEAPVFAWHDGTLIVRLDPTTKPAATTAIAELCEHLTATQTRYPGTDLVLPYEVKPRTDFRTMSGVLRFRVVREGMKLRLTGAPSRVCPVLISRT